MERERLLYGRLGIPLELEESLPWWLRFRNGLFVTPLGIAALIAWRYGYALTGTVLLAASFAVICASFWIARAWLDRNGKWKRGTWHAEVLPGIYRLRATVLVLLMISISGSYLLLEAKMKVQGLFAVTVTALTLVVPTFIWLSVRQGYVGGGMGDVDFKDKNPARFWLGLFAYSALMGVFAVAIIWVVVRTYANGA